MPARAACLAVPAIAAALLASAAAAQSAPSAASPIAACGDEAVTFSVERGPVGDNPAAVPSPGQATLYIIELYNLRDKGRFNRPTIRQALDGSWIGATQGFTYLKASIAPGTHHLCSRWQSHSSSLSDQISLNNFNAVAGQSYYFRVQISVEGDSGGGAISIDLVPLSEEEGRFLVSEAAQGGSKPKH